MGNIKKFWDEENPDNNDRYQSDYDLWKYSKSDMMLFAERYYQEKLNHSVSHHVSDIPEIKFKSTSEPTDGR